VGARNAAHLSDRLILVEQSAEPITPPDGVHLARRALRDWSSGRGLAEGAMRTVGVVVLFKFAEGCCGVSLIEDEDAVEEFTADYADEAFRDRVCPRRPRRLSVHPALHRTHAVGSMFSVGQADGIVVPLQR
jgi:hypothetical protein